MAKAWCIQRQSLLCTYRPAEWLMHDKKYANAMRNCACNVVTLDFGRCASVLSRTKSTQQPQQPKAHSVRCNRVRLRAAKNVVAGGIKQLATSCSLHHKDTSLEHVACQHAVHMLSSTGDVQGQMCTLRDALSLAGGCNLGHCGIVAGAGHRLAAAVSCWCSRWSSRVG